jgi:hypothetical protein
MAEEVKTVTPQAAEVSICDGCALGEAAEAKLYEGS